MLRAPKWYTLVPATATIAALLFYLNAGDFMGNHAGSTEKSLSISTGVGPSLFGPKAPLTLRDSFYSAVLGNLVTLEKSYVLRPSLLENWHYDFANKKYVLRLRQDLKFPDGEPLTAYHAEFGILRWLFTSKPNIQSHYIRHIEGAEDIERGSSYRSGLVRGVSVVDPHTIHIRLKETNAGFMYSLALSSRSPVRPEDLEDDLLTWKTWPMGAGAFKVVEFDENARVTTLERVSESGGGNLAQIKFQHDETNWRDSDLIIWPKDDPSPNEALENKLIHDNVDLGYILQFNYLTERAKSDEYRKALNYVIDRTALSRTCAHCEPLDKLLPKTFWGIDHKPIERNVDKAKEHLEAADIPKGTVLKMLVSKNRYENENIEPEKLIASQIEELGLKVELIPTGGSIKLESSDYDLFFYWLGVGDIVDPLEQYSLFLPGTPYIDMLLPQDQRFLDLYKSAQAAESFDVRVEYTRKLAEYAKSQTYFLPVFSQNANIWLAKGSPIDLGDQRSSLVFYLDRVRLD